MKLTLPTDSAERKGIPLRSGCYDYFPAALAGVAKHSKMSNDKHNPGLPLQHSRGKSNDHADCIERHMMDLADMLARERVASQTTSHDILAEANALAWRALALSQELHERFGAPLAPAARLPQKPVTFQDVPYAGEAPTLSAEEAFVQPPTVPAAAADPFRNRVNEALTRLTCGCFERCKGHMRPVVVKPCPVVGCYRVYAHYHQKDGSVSWMERDLTASEKYPSTSGEWLSGLHAAPSKDDLLAHRSE